MDGIDEENCDLLEFNEYRCNVGMCMPEEYWLDGKGNDKLCMLNNTTLFYSNLLYLIMK